MDTFEFLENLQRQKVGNPLEDFNCIVKLSFSAPLTCDMLYAIRRASRVEFSDSNVFGRHCDFRIFLLYMTSVLIQLLKYRRSGLLSAPC